MRSLQRSVGENGRIKPALLLFVFGFSVPLTALSLTLSDYLNEATVTASSDQFESDTNNNDDSVQITVNAELVVVKQVVNDNGGNATLADFSVASSAGALTFDAGVVAGTTTTYTAEVIYLPPGSYTLSETDFAGYTEGSWSCSAGTVGSDSFDAGSVTLGIGEQAVCTIINDDDAPTLTLAKTVTNDNGGILTDADFGLAIDGTAVVSAAATVVDANTSILISELDVDGYTEGTWACVDNNGLTTGLPTAGSATGETIVLASGADVTCSITNDDIEPTLTLTKTLVNDNGGALTIEDFDIAIDATEVVSGVATPVLANTAVTISELDVPGYSEGAWVCNDANGLTAGLPTAGLATGEAITLASGADVTCAITNDDIAPTLTLTKTLLNDNGGVSTIDDFDVSIDGVEVVNGAVNTVTANTPIVISELDLDGYTEGTWACSDTNALTTVLPSAGLATGETIELAPGSNVTCEITNNDVAPSLTLVKVITNDNGGDKTIADFDIAIDGTEVVSGANNIVAANTDIVISELELAGYTAGTWACTDSTGLTTSLPTAGAASGETFQLAEGAIVTCEITNDDIAPLLTLTKDVLNDNGGLKVVDDFDISIDGTEVASGVASTVVANTNILLSELDLPGYTEGTWSCVDANGLTTTLPGAGDATSTLVNLLPGSDVNCSIENDDIAPTLTLTKTLINDNGGDLTIADFDVSIDGVEVVNGATNTVNSNVAILVSELDLPGYTEGTWACSDTTSLTTALPTAGLATGETLTLSPGSEVVCEITNDDIAPTLTLTKTVVNDHGGDKLISDFDISIDGAEVPNGLVNTVSANVGIVISELALPGYVAGTWSCSDSTALTTGLPSAGVATGETLTLKPGSEVVCDISNDDIEPTLTLVKTVVNDNGGNLAIADFDIAIDGTEVVSGVANPVLANTPITISELDLVPYAEGTWSCTDAAGLTTSLPSAGSATSTSVTLLPGSDVTCEITNNDLGIDLSIVKSVDDSTPNIGQLITFTLVVSNAGPDVATDVTVTDVVPAGFTYSAASMTGGDVTDETDPAGAGLSWTINSMPVGTPVTLTFQATVNAP